MHAGCLPMLETLRTTVKVENWPKAKIKLIPSKKDEILERQQTDFERKKGIEELQAVRSEKPRKREKDMSRLSEFLSRLSFLLTAPG